MKQKTSNAVISSLYHDVGKLIFRSKLDAQNLCVLGKEYLSSVIKNNDILEGVEFHYKKDIEISNLPNDSVAYLVYIANNISSGTDKRDYESETDNSLTSNKNMPLYSVFNLLNGDSKNLTYKFQRIAESVICPNSGINKISPLEYNELLVNIKNALQDIKTEDSSLTSYLEIAESFMSLIPSNANIKQPCDISLFDHCRITACIAGCISEFLIENNISDFKNELFINEQVFMEKSSFIMYSMALSGIQNFIYSIDYKNALKSLRARSFYLEMLMENIIDEILNEIGLSRANLIYSGGGHCYILLPNTENVKNTLKSAQKSINSFFIDNFGISLYLATAFVECTGNVLINKDSKNETYNNIFKNLFRKLNENKMNRYTFEQINHLNNAKNQNHQCECKICGSTSALINELCYWCNSFSNISNEILTNDLIMTVTKKEINNANCIKLPSINGTTYLNFTHDYNTKQRINAGTVLRIYCKNKISTDFSNSTKIYVGDYCFSKELTELMDNSDGINRISVLRMDVDNLGLAFTSGFDRKRYKTLARTASLSRQLSIFFKFNINKILQDLYPEKENKVVIVYSGGDDIFLVGSWLDIINSGKAINDKFKDFCMGRLTLSAGIGIFNLTYPIIKSANETAELEEKSKKLDGKNAITLFTSLEDHTYKWDIFCQNVLSEKFELIKDFFSNNDFEKGNSFLYKMLILLKESEDKINIARFAYCLAKLEPITNDFEIKFKYKKFSKKMFEWINNKEDTKQLITAIYVYIYMKRNGSAKND